VPAASCTRVYVCKTLILSGTYDGSTFPEVQLALQ
jgi:hypothetical protein